METLTETMSGEQGTEESSDPDGELPQVQEVTEGNTDLEDVPRKGSLTSTGEIMQTNDLTISEPSNATLKSDNTQRRDSRRKAEHAKKLSERQGSGSSSSEEPVLRKRDPKKHAQGNKGHHHHPRHELDRGKSTVDKTVGQFLPPPPKKTSEPILPSQTKRKTSTYSLKGHKPFNNSGNARAAPSSFTMPAPVNHSSEFTRNSMNRSSLTRLFSRSSSHNHADKLAAKHAARTGGTAYGSQRSKHASSGRDAAGGGEKNEQRRSQFLNKRSITSLSLFNAKKDDDQSSKQSKGGGSSKERKTSVPRLRAAKSSLDLSTSHSPVTQSRPFSVGLKDLKEEIAERPAAEKNRYSDRPWFDLTRVWRDQTKDLCADEVLNKMRKERSMRPKTIPSRNSKPDSLGSACVSDVEEAVAEELGLISQPPLSLGPPPSSSSNSSSCVNVNQAASGAGVAPSALKKTVHLLSPEVFTNWYEKRKKGDNFDGPRRNSISNLFITSDENRSVNGSSDNLKNVKFHGAAQPLIGLLKGDRTRSSMHNLEELLYSGGDGSKDTLSVGSNSNSSTGKGIHRSESVKLPLDKSHQLAGGRWKAANNGRGIQRSESARIIGHMRHQSPLLNNRQNSHPTLSHQYSYSSSSSSLADPNSQESPTKMAIAASGALAMVEGHSNKNKDSPDSGLSDYGGRLLPSSRNHSDSSDSDGGGDGEPPDWRQRLSGEQLASLTAKEVKRQDVINELFQTENSHVRNLKVLDSVFRQPLIESGRMSKDFVDRLFSNLDQVLAIHQQFNNALKARLRQGFPVLQLGDVLEDMFLHDNGERLIDVGGQFTKSQNSTIEELKRLRARDPKLEAFLSEQERKPDCRRLQLQSILPMEHQRLVKYPLLLEQMAKYTERDESDPSRNHEHRSIMAATEQTREILDQINQLVAEEQNRERLANIQANLDTSGLEKLGSDHPICKEYRSVDLTRHRLIYDGVLTMKLGESQKRVKSLHLLALEDCLMLLQKQGDRYLLKFHSSSSGTEPSVPPHGGSSSSTSGGASSSSSSSSSSRRHFHSPIIKYSTVHVRPVAAEKRAFFLLHTTDSLPQIYEMVASSTSERTKWVKNISDLVAAAKSGDGKDGVGAGKRGLFTPADGKAGMGVKNNDAQHRSHSFREQTNSPKLERADRQNSLPPESEYPSSLLKDKRTSIDESAEDEKSESSQPPGPSDGSGDVANDAEGGKQPGSANGSPRKRLQRVEILKIVDSPPMVDPSEVMVKKTEVFVADPVVTPYEMLKQKDEEVTRILEEKQKLVAEILNISDDLADANSLPLVGSEAAKQRPRPEIKDVLYSALTQAKLLTAFVNKTLKLKEEDVVSCRSSPGRGSCSSPAHTLTTTPVDGHQLIQITDTMNRNLRDLLAIAQEREEERARLRRELAKTQEEIRRFHTGGVDPAEGGSCPPPPPGTLEFVPSVGGHRSGRSACAVMTSPRSKHLSEGLSSMMCGGGGGESSRPNSLLSTESSDLMDLDSSDPRQQHSHVSLDSNNTADLTEDSDLEEINENLSREKSTTARSRYEVDC